jgi:hypothetical protein
MAEIKFTEQEARQGYAMRNGTKHYCCYGMYADVGHSEDCKHFWKEKNEARKAGSAGTRGVQENGNGR